MRSRTFRSVGCLVLLCVGTPHAFAAAPPRPSRPPNGPGRGTTLSLPLQQKLGEWALRSRADAKVTAIDLFGARLTDTALAALADYPSLRSLSLSCAAVTDRQLEALGRSPRLTHLDLQQ